MKRKVIIFSISFLILTTMCLLHIVESSGTVSDLKKVANEIIQSNSLNYLIENIDVQYSYSTIEINLELKNQYDELETINQFAVFEYFQRQLRHYLLTSDNQNTLHISDLKLIGNTDSNKYLLSSEIPNKKLVHYKTENLFYINNKKSYNTSTLNHLLYNSRKDKAELELEVLNYADNKFRLITSAGHDYTHKTDSKIILDMISQKFGITHEEFHDIYFHYYLGINFNPFLDASNQ
ncbi:hypothetical protein [Bacillus massiliigorillae]|uniref:hypothetical protein n=1 Tax=Bacillus massiliigorillae TaxID=1243664 RepID=UPI000399B8ED|nr:hypothetical protein [Bacillus massiliigorillae]